MNRDWQYLQSLFHAALSLRVEDRAAYLERECVGEEALRTEVESLLAASEQGDDFLVEPVLNAGLQVLAADRTDQLTDNMIGSFKILQLLGNGGMGDVYLAEDTQLGRKVALKFLSGKWSQSSWAKRQFAKEAQAVAMLDHQNICHVHRFEEANGFRFIVMQYVEGESLDQIMRARKVELPEVLSIAIKIASALAHAHAHGIIHRDVKPSNIMVTTDGQLKVLDFGLAKIVQEQQAGLIVEDESNSSLQLGFIPGTVPYMSPEQLRGQKLDYRTDIFSFGVVFYELINGSNPFACEDNAEAKTPVPTGQWQSLKATVPRVSRELNRVAQKCLAGERSGRFQSVSELLVDLKTLQRLVDGDRRNHRLPSVRAVAAATLLLLLITVSAFTYDYLSRPRTIVVLPIINETGATKLDHLSDGLTESFINKLSGLDRLRVKPFSMISGYKGQRPEPQKIGRDLKADAVIVGKLTGTGDAPSLQLVLIDTEDGSTLWGNIYDLQLADLFHVEDDVSRQLVSKLELWSHTDRVKIEQMPRARNSEAYDEYMLGRHFWGLRDKEKIKEAIAHFNNAINLDPLYARAFAGLAECYVLGNTVHYGSMDPKEAMAKAEAAAREALRLDDKLPEAHTALGVVYWRRYWNWTAAETEFKTAILLDPNFAPAHYAYSNVLAITQRLPAATYESEIANDLDPFSPAANMNYCRTFYFARDYNRATACFEKLVNEHPNYGNGQYVLGLIYLQKGMYEEATRIFETLYAADKVLAGSALGYTYGVRGRQKEALRVMSELQALKTPESYISPQEYAIIYMGIGEKDNAFIWLKKAADEHFAPLAYIMIDPLFDSIRSDGRFAELPRTLNLPL